MAKRPAEDEEDEVPKVRKRRYNPPKKEEDDEDAGPPGKGKKGKPQEEEEDDEDGEGSISTGNVYLDITLDFFDDCIDWSKTHLLYAIIIGAVSFLIFSALVFFSINAFARYLNRPSLATVTKAYDLGLFPETKFLADEALRYISRLRPDRRSPFVFFQGAALCAVAERVAVADQPDYYLTAANYLKEAAKYNFFPSRASEGWFLLGKSLFLCNELEQCRLPLTLALDEGYPHTKEIHWYLAHAYFLGAFPDLKLAREHLQRFQNESTALEEDIAESRLLETLIVLHTEDINAAEEILAKVARFTRFNILRHYVEGQIEFFKARKLRDEAINFETDPNPSLLRRQPEADSESTPNPSPPLRPVVAPAPVSPESQPVPETVPSSDVPTAPVPVLPMDEASVRELMVPKNFPVPVLGIFDSTSEIQRRIAEMRSKYAEDMTSVDDEIIVLPRQDARQAPIPPPPIQDLPSQESTVDPFGGDPILRLAWEIREKANGHYQNAIAHFGEVVRLSGFYDLWGRSSRLLIGICYMEMGDLNNSEGYFRRLVETYPTSQEAATASFFLGEQNRMKGNADAAFRSFAQSFEVLRRNPNYASLWLPREMIEERCADMVRTDIAKQNYAEAVRLLNALVGIIPADEIARLMGETYESWATMLQTQANVTFGERGEQLSKDAETRWRNAGAAFMALAQLCADTLEFSDILWRAAESYRFGKDYRSAAITYQKFATVNLAAHRPEANLRRGEMYLHLNLLDEAVYVLEEALRDYPTHFLIPQIRLVLSHAYFELKEWEKAKALLQFNLIGDAAPTSASYRDSMYELGRVSYTQGDLDSTISYLEDAIKIHPDAIQAADANYMLARTYLKQAKELLDELINNPPETVRRSVESLVQANRQRAFSYLDQTEAILSERQRTLGLTEAEHLMLRNAQFTTCVVLMDMEQYNQAVPRLNALATIYQSQPEALEALSKLAFCQRMIGMETEAQTTLRQAEVILNQLERNGMISDGTNWRNAIQGQMRGGRSTVPTPEEG